MEHPEILLVMILMFSDYYLTLFGAKLRDREYSKYFKVKYYELNPIWQRDIKNKKLFNIRLLLMLLFSFCFFIYIFEFDEMSDLFKEILIGALLTHYGMLTGRHISNIFTYNYTEKHPEELSGEITISHSYNLHTSIFQYSVAIVPIAIIAIVNQTPILVGCVLGALINIVIHFLWIKKYKNTITV